MAAMEKVERKQYNMSNAHKFTFKSFIFERATDNSIKRCVSCNQDRINMQELLDKIKWYKSNLSINNIEDFNSLIKDIEERLPESYLLKIEPLNFYEEINENPFIDLPF